MSNNINGLGNPAPIQRAQTARTAYKQEAQTPATAPARGQDQVELSPEVQALLDRLKTNGIRTEKVQQVRQAIAEGTYETPQKLGKAMDRLLDDLLA